MEQQQLQQQQLQQQVTGISTLTVHVYEARELSYKNALPQGDTYCLLQITHGGISEGHKHNAESVGQVVQTSGIQGLSNPMWNTGFRLAVRDPQADTLHIRVYDHKNASKDRIIGESVVPLLGLTNGAALDQWVPISGRKVGGTLHLGLSLRMPGQSSASALPSSGIRTIGSTFRVTIMEARNIARKDLVSPSDPYIQLGVSHRGAASQRHSHLFGGKQNWTTQQMRTFACRNTINPVWNQTFEMVCTDPNQDQLEILCYDKDDVKKDDFIGNALVPLTGLASGNVSDQWVRLGGKVNQFDGSCHIIITPLDSQSFGGAGLSSGMTTGMMTTGMTTTGMTSSYESGYSSGLAPVTGVSSYTTQSQYPSGIIGASAPSATLTSGQILQPTLSQNSIQAGQVLLQPGLGMNQGMIQQPLGMVQQPLGMTQQPATLVTAQPATLLMGQQNLQPMSIGQGIMASNMTNATTKSYSTAL